MQILVYFYADFDGHGVDIPGLLEFEGFVEEDFGGEGCIAVFSLFRITRRRVCFF